MASDFRSKLEVFKRGGNCDRNCLLMAVSVSHGALWRTQLAGSACLTDIPRRFKHVEVKLSGPLSCGIDMIFLGSGCRGRPVKKLLLE